MLQSREFYKPDIMRKNDAQAFLITVEGNVTELTPDNGSTFTLKEAQKHVDGYIEIVYLQNEWIMVVNEEGKFTKEYNDLATRLADLHNALFNGDYISGNVILCKSAMLP